MPPSERPHPGSAGLRAWPEGNERIDVAAALRPLVEALRQGGEGSAGARYAEAGGYDIGAASKATVPGPHTLLDGELSGADPLWDEPSARALWVAFLLGIEQGRREERVLPSWEDEPTLDVVMRVYRDLGALAEMADDGRLPKHEGDRIGILRLGMRNLRESMRLAAEIKEKSKP